MNSGKTLKLFMADGSFGGLVTTEIMNWTGHVLSAPRSGLGELLKRTEVSRTGLYILLGEDPDILGGQMAYVGEADNIGNRLRTHVKEEAKGGKDFWDRVIILTSKDSNLTKAHARYLESRFIALALQAGRTKLVNNTNPDPLALPEADISDMEYYITQAQIVLPVLGVNLLRTKSAAGAQISDNSLENTIPDSPLFYMQIPGGGSAYAQEIDGEFTVLKDSEARRNWASTDKLKSGSHARRDYREALISSGVLEYSKDNTCLTFTENHVFSSPSAAASIVAATESRNGRAEWKVKETGIAYGDWQTRGV